MAIVRPRIPNETTCLVAPGVQLWQQGTQLVVFLGGEHDMSTAAPIAAVLADVAQTGGDVVVDLSLTEFIDAAVVAVLIGGHNRLKAESRRLTLRAPSPFVARVLHLCGLQGLLD